MTVLEDKEKHHNMYMGTTRDYDFYMATRIMIRSLARMEVNVYRVIIASLDVSRRWV